MLMGWAIASLCANINNYANHQDACNKFFEASAKQTQIWQFDDKVEGYFKAQVKEKTNKVFGKTTETVVGGTYFVYKSYKNKAIDVKLPNMGLCDMINTHIGQDNGSLNFGWSF